MDNYLVYIAAPFFNPDQINTVISIEQTLSEIGCSFFSPRLQGPNLKSLPESEREAAAVKVLRSNVEGLAKSKVLLHVLMKDEGAAWEQGYWCGTKGFTLERKNYDSPIVTLTFDDKPLNVMYRQFSCAHLHSIKELTYFFMYYCPDCMAHENPFDQFQNYGNKIT